MDLLATIHDGFASVNAEAAYKDQALKNVGQWLSGADTADYRPQIEWLVSAGKFADLLDCFYQVLPFGTGGRRGAVGIGPNRMNLWTLGASVQGHCDYLKARFSQGGQPIHVVLAYDVRYFEDNRRAYNPDLPNPIVHLSSRDFARYAACIYVANGLHAHVLPDESKRYLATPELSFAIRELRAHGGLNISASHNPPDDNGGKFYDERGAQPVVPEDQIMSDMVEQVTQVHSMSWPEAKKSGRVHDFQEVTHQGYIELCRRQSVTTPPRSGEIRVVYTPLHGVGGMTAGEVLTVLGFKPIPVESQMAPDGQFPNVTKSPNPEVPECFDKAIVVGLEKNAHLLVATDPDADRIGGMVSDSLDGGGHFRFLTGNEIAAILTHFKLSQLVKQGVLPPAAVVVKTEVTTSLVSRIARSFNAQVVENLLVGFKFIADVLHQLETTGEYEDVSGSPTDFVLGCEESHGIQTTAQVRDKDAGGAAVLLAEMALECRRAGKTVVAYLDELAAQFGYYRNEVMNIVMTGIEGKSNMNRMLGAIRDKPPTSIAGIAVERFEDLRSETSRMGPLRGATDASGRNFLIFRLKDGAGLSAKVVMRPSGTEPKAKAYLEVSTAPRSPGMSDADWKALCDSADALAHAIAGDFLRTSMATVGLTPAPGADKLSR